MGLQKAHLVVLSLIFSVSNVLSQTLPKKPSIENIRTFNQANLMKINIGDTKKQVIDAMGGIKVYDYYEYDWNNIGFNKNKKKGSISNPYSRDLKNGKDSVIIEILWYYTDIKSQDKIVRKEDLTPVIIEKNLVIGLGWGFYEDYAKRKEITINVN